MLFYGVPETTDEFRRFWFPSSPALIFALPRPAKTYHCSDLNMRRELFHGNLSVTKDLLCCEVSSREVSWEEWFCVYNIRWILYHRLFEIMGSFFYRIRIIDLCNFLGCMKSYQRYWWVLGFCVIEYCCCITESVRKVLFAWSFCFLFWLMYWNIS